MPSSRSDSDSKEWIYDVFLSFCGKDDSCKSFASDLYAALTNAGGHVFRSDDRLRNSEETIPLSVLHAIQRSRISIIVFSRNYADSRWCLQELEKIMECRRTLGQKVVPVFYEVARCDVSYRTSVFRGTFEELTQRFLVKQDRLTIWKTALSLAANLSGFATIDYRDESEVIKKAVEYVFHLTDQTDLFVADYPVGVESRVQDVIQLLNSQQNINNNVTLVGIWGMGGIGKTTIAKAIYNKIGHNFESKSFISNISMKGKNFDELKSFLTNGEGLLSKERLSQKKLLLVLDDVDNMEQWSALCGSREWFGSGSKIIITTRDKYLLNAVGVDCVYRVTELDHSESLELFSLWAYRQPFPRDGFFKRSKEIVRHSDGLPLALKVIGSILISDIEESMWKDALESLKGTPNRIVEDVLSRSYNELEDSEEKMFVDIACFFVGLDQNDVIRTLDISGHFAENGISVLEEKSLVTIDENNRLRMHNLLQQMGQVRRKLSPHEQQPKIYDVFLSFRGEDTRASFTSNLNTSLQNAGIYTFKDDDEIERGEHISVSLLQAIRRSRIAIVVLSRNYANSKWCMIELENIMENCRIMNLVVVPVFYQVDPSEVRNQTGEFGKAFNDLMIRVISANEDEEEDEEEDGDGDGEEYGYDKGTKWKRELLEVGGRAGFVVINSRNESDDITKIVEHVTNLLDRKDLFVADHPVGVVTRMQDVIGLLSNRQSKHPLLLGIWGMGGIGKTTIAKAIYNQIGRDFEARSFLLNVREYWEQNNGQVSLQRRLLSDIYKTIKIKISTVESGKIILKERLAQKKIFLVLDDVNKLDQLSALCGSREWFGQESAIIITTRDEDLLQRLEVDYVYRIQEMDENESLELFSWHAFRQPSPREGFGELSRDVVKYSGGLPLALQVIGSFLLTKEAKREWKSVLKKLKVIPDDKILTKLRISFDGLSDDDIKEIFLDIAFFFIGMDQDDVIEILNDCGHFTEIGIRVLVQQSLITVDNKNRIGMHDLLRDMGREIVRKKSKEDGEERSRLWLYKDLLDELSKYTRAMAIEGLTLKLPIDDTPTYLEAKAFEKMERLRLLQLAGVHLNGDYRYVSRDLRWLCWHGFPLKCTPEDFHQGNLVAIELKYSNLQLMWKKPQILQKLKLLNLSHSHNLRHTPDFSKLPNLEKLILKDCPNLSFVSHTIGDLKKILLINLKNCTKLCTLPRSIYQLKSLKTLILSGCSKIDKLEEDLEQMESLTTLIADKSGITRVPFAVVRSKSIAYISLGDFEGFSHQVFPSIIKSWMSPTNCVLSFVKRHEQDSSCFHGLPSIIKVLQKLPHIWLKCKSQVQLIQTVEIILNILDANRVQSDAMRSASSSFIGFGIQDSNNTAASSKNLLTSLLFQMGMNCHIANVLRERILQKMLPVGFGLLPSDNYPNWLTFNGEGSSVSFEVPEIVGRDLKTIMCIVYFSFPKRKTSEGLQNVLVINYTKTTIQLYKRDALSSLEKEDEWHKVISNSEPGDKLKIIVIFGNGFTVKNTVVYFIYDDEPTYNKMKHYSDKRTKTVIASGGGDEIENPKRVEFRQALELHDDLDFIFGETVTTSKNVGTPTLDVPVKLSGKIIASDTSWKIVESDDGEYNLDEVDKVKKGKAKVWSTTLKRTTLEPLVQANESYSESKIDDIAITSYVQDQYSIPNCIQVLKTLKEGGHLNGRQFSFALELIKDNQNRVIFMTLKDSMDALVEWILFKYDL